MPEAGEGGAGDSSAEREPTSHERRADAEWDASYREETPAPWDIGRPQSAFGALAAAGRWRGAVLDSGCGTGEHALLAASLGLSVLGVDVAATALAMARDKALARGLAADFALADALHLDRLERRFDTVLDCGLFHTFDGEERRAYVAGLAAVTAPGATLFVLCFRDASHEVVGPHAVSEEELHGAFAADAGWRLAGLERSRIEVTLEVGEFPAWLVTVARS